MFVMFASLSLCSSCARARRSLNVLGPCTMALAAPQTSTATNRPRRSLAPNLPASCPLRALVVPSSRIAVFAIANHLFSLTEPTLHALFMPSSCPRRALFTNCRLCDCASSLLPYGAHSSRPLHAVVMPSSCPLHESPSLRLPAHSTLSSPFGCPAHHLFSRTEPCKPCAFTHLRILTQSYAPTYFNSILLYFEVVYYTQFCWLKQRSQKITPLYVRPIAETSDTVGVHHWCY